MQAITEASCASAPAWFRGIVYWACYGLYAFDAAAGESVFSVPFDGYAGLGFAVSMAIDESGVVVVEVEGYGDTSMVRVSIATPAFCSALL